MRTLETLQRVNYHILGIIIKALTMFLQSMFVGSCWVGTPPLFHVFHFYISVKAKWSNECADFLEFYLSLCFFLYTLGMMLTNFNLNWWFGLLSLNIIVSVDFKTKMSLYYSVRVCGEDSFPGSTCLVTFSQFSHGRHCNAVSSHDEYTDDILGLHSHDFM